VKVARTVLRRAALGNMCRLSDKKRSGLYLKMDKFNSELEDVEENSVS
jgi:hypothetical protein